MKLETAAFVRLRRLAPVLDDVLNAGEVEQRSRLWILLHLPSFAHSYSMRTIADTRARLRKCDPTPSRRSNTFLMDWLTAAMHR